LTLTLAIGVVIGFLLGRPWRKAGQDSATEAPPEQPSSSS
jgi:hypothetical protein